MRHLKKICGLHNTKYAAEIWYRIAWNQLPHLVPLGTGHMNGAICCWQQDGRGTKPNRNSLTETKILLKLPSKMPIFAGKNMRYAHFAEICKKCDNKRTTNDTIRDAILTCARKPIWIGLIYRTETTTKNCKTEKPKSKSRYARSNSKSGESCSKFWKKKGCSGKDLEKKVLSLEWKREWVMKN